MHLKNKKSCYIPSEYPAHVDMLEDVNRRILPRRMQFDYVSNIIQYKTKFGHTNKFLNY